MITWGSYSAHRQPFLDGRLVGERLRTGEAVQELAAHNLGLLLSQFGRESVSMNTVE